MPARFVGGSVIVVGAVHYSCIRAWRRWRDDSARLVGADDAEVDVNGHGLALVGSALLFDVLVDD